jgi:putative transposase
LGEACRHYGVLVHAYALMTNHVHLLMTPRIADGVSRVMQSVGARYVRYVNRSRERSGSLWEGRYRACLVACDRHLLAACRYIDLNPVRAGLAAHPADYGWSSYLALVGSRNDTLVTHIQCSTRSARRVVKPMPNGAPRAISTRTSTG